MGILDSLKAADKMKADLQELRNPKIYTNFPNAIRAFSKVFPGRIGTRDRLYPSGIGYVCPREFVLNYWNPQFSSPPEFKNMLMMDSGTFMHEFFQDHILGPMGVLKGMWQHTVTNQLVEGYHPDAVAAVSQYASRETKPWRFVETKFYLEEERLSGKGDGIVSLDRLKFLSDNLYKVRKNPHSFFEQIWDIDPGDEADLEIKTTNDHTYSSLTDVSSLTDGHKMQAATYQKVTGNRKTVFLFLNRDKMTMKSILYERDPSYWNIVKGKCDLIWDAIKTRTLPVSGASCTSASDNRAKKCPQCGPCFNKYAAGQFRDWTIEQQTNNPDLPWLHELP